MNKITRFLVFILCAVLIGSTADMIQNITVLAAVAGISSEIYFLSDGKTEYASDETIKFQIKNFDTDMTNYYEIKQTDGNKLTFAEGSLPKDLSKELSVNAPNAAGNYVLIVHNGKNRVPQAKFKVINGDGAYGNISTEAVMNTSQPGTKSLIGRKIKWEHKDTDFTVTRVVIKDDHTPDNKTLTTFDAGCSDKTGNIWEFFDGSLKAGTRYCYTIISKTDKKFTLYLTTASDGVTTMPGEWKKYGWIKLKVDSWYIDISIQKDNDKFESDNQRPFYYIKGTDKPDQNIKAKKNKNGILCVPLSSIVEITSGKIEAGNRINGKLTAVITYEYKENNSWYKKLDITQDNSEATLTTKDKDGKTIESKIKLEVSPFIDRDRFYFAVADLRKLGFEVSDDLLFIDFPVEISADK